MPMPENRPNRKVVQLSLTLGEEYRGLKEVMNRDYFSHPTEITSKDGPYIIEHILNPLVSFRQQLLTRHGLESIHNHMIYDFLDIPEVKTAFLGYVDDIYSNKTDQSPLESLLESSPEAVRA